LSVISLRFQYSCNFQSERTFHGKLVWKKWEWRAKKVVRIQKSEKCSEFLLLVLVYVCVYMYVSWGREQHFHFKRIGNIDKRRNYT